MYIILELYLLENFIINYLILYLTKIITSSKVKYKKLIIGAIISSIYSLVFFYPSLFFMTRLNIKLLISSLIIKLTFGSRTLKQFLFQLLAFFITSFVLAGLMVGLSWNFKAPIDMFFERVNILSPIKSKYIILGLVIGGPLIKKIFQYNFGKNMKKDYILDVEIIYKGKSKTIPALIDTGNSLIEPLTGKEVFVVEFDEIKDLFSEEAVAVYEAILLNKEGIWLDHMERYFKDMNLVLIPFKSIGSRGGIIPGFKPDCIIIKKTEEEFIKKDLIIGLYKGCLSSGLDYRGLLHYKTTLREDWNEID